MIGAGFHMLSLDSIFLYSFELSAMFCENGLTWADSIYTIFLSW